MENNKGKLMFWPNSTERTQDKQYFDADAYYKTLCDELATSRDLISLTAHIQAIIDRLGFTDFMFIRLEKQWQTSSTRGLLTSFPQPMRQEYQESHLYRHDLLLSYARANTRPIFGSQVYGYVDAAPFDMALTINNRQLINFYRRYHYLEQLAIPSTAINGSGHVLLLLTSQGKSKEDMQTAANLEMTACRALCKAIDVISTQRFRTTFIDANDTPLLLTPKPLAILQALANTDASITEIADQLCISPITAHQHVAAARKALGVSTTIGAIVKAIKTGLISID